MKASLKLLIGLTLILACKKVETFIIPGRTYRVQSNVFNKGVWQPKDTLYANSIYFNAAAGLNYCKCSGPGIGVPVTVGAADIDSLRGEPLWDIPTDDLK